MKPLKGCSLTLFVAASAFPAAVPLQAQSAPTREWQPLAGVGDEAWFRPNRTEADGYVEAVKPGTVSLATALLAKLQ